METKKLFEKYYARLRTAGIIKSLIFSGIIGFAVMFGIAITLWFMDPAVWEVIVYSLGAGIVVTALFMPLFYFTRFRPSTQGIARLIDRMGLEERIITMYELEQDESYIAMKQREDAKTKMDEVNEKQIKFRLSKVALVFLAVVGVFGIGMTTISILGAHGIIDKEAFNEPIIEAFDPPEYCEINYVAYGFGMIEGEEAQLVVKGEDATPVVAIADDGYIFMGWDDGVETPDRWDRAVQDHLYVNAVFVPVQESEDGESSQQPQQQPPEMELPEEEQPQDEPQDEEEPDSEQQEEQEQQPQDPQEQPPSEDEGEGSSGQSLYDNNTIVDGETDYTTEFDYDTNMEDLAGDDSLPPDLKDAIGGYYDTLKP